MRLWETRQTTSSPFLLPNKSPHFSLSFVSFIFLSWITLMNSLCTDQSLPWGVASVGRCRWTCQRKRKLKTISAEGNYDTYVISTSQLRFFYGIVVCFSIGLINHHFSLFKFIQIQCISIFIVASYWWTLSVSWTKQTSEGCSSFRSIDLFSEKPALNSSVHHTYVFCCIVLPVSW